MVTPRRSGPVRFSVVLKVVAPLLSCTRVLASLSPFPASIRVTVMINQVRVSSVCVRCLEMRSVLFFSARVQS